MSWSKKAFNPFPNKPLFLRFSSTSLLKIQWEKEKLLVTSNFSFCHGVFYQCLELSAFFIKFEFCCLQTLSVWKSLKFVIWERVKNIFGRKKMLAPGFSPFPEMFSYILSLYQTIFAFNNPE